MHRVIWTQLDAVLRYGNLQCSHALCACKASDRGTTQDCQRLDYSLTKIVISLAVQAGPELLRNLVCAELTAAMRQPACALQSST